MKTVIRFLILLAAPAIAGTAMGHGFNLSLTNPDGIYGINAPYSITSSSGEDQLDDGGTPGNASTIVNGVSYPEADYLFFEDFSGTPTTTFGAPFYSVVHGFAVTDGAWPSPNVPGYTAYGWTATYNMISPLYYSDGTADAVPATSGTYIRMNDRYIGVAVDPGTSPGYVYINGSTPFAAGFQVSLDEPHEIEKDLYIAPGSTQTYGEYGFAYDVTLTFNNGQTVTTGPLVDVFSLAGFDPSDQVDPQQQNATTAIYNAAINAGVAVLGTTSSWSASANTVWNNSANWASGAVPGSASGTTSNDTVVLFSGNSAPVVDAGRNVQTILFEGAGAGTVTLGATTGNSLLLTNGGSIQVTSWVVNPQVVNAPLVLEGANALYTFNSDSTTTSATLSFGGSIIGGAAGNTVLTLGGDNAGANTISGAIGNGAATSLALLESGPGAWILSGPNTYTGGTTINQGTLTVTATGTLGSSTNPLTISTAANGISAIVNINGNQSVGTLSATILGGGTTGTLNITAGSTLHVNQAANETFGATLNIAAGTSSSFGTFALQGPNTLEIDAPPTLGANSAVAVNGGTLRFNVAGAAATIGSGVTVTVASGATLQLAGSISALSGGGLANIVNNGSTASGGGLLVTGTNQSVGAISGTASPSGPTTYSGDTVVGAAGSAASLTATQILQNTLTINAGSTVTIEPSASSLPTVSAAIAAAESDDPFSEILDSATTVAIAHLDPEANSVLGADDPELNTAALNAAVSMILARSAAIGSSGINREELLAWWVESHDPLFSELPSNMQSELEAVAFDWPGSSSVGNAGMGATAVPEPTAFLLAIVGSAAVALVMRSRRIRGRSRPAKCARGMP